MSESLITYDNHSLHVPDRQQAEDLSLIANKSIKRLCDANPHLLVFPHVLGQHGDEIEKQTIFELANNELNTNNIMGFVGVNDTHVNIQSRFAKKVHEDYFLHYMLSRVLSVNIFDLKTERKRSPVFDFLLYLFPHHLNTALQQGLFKQYEHRQYNDANVRGSIDISQHIKKNIPFHGSVAYSTRDHCVDNTITQLVRHTIEHLRQRPEGKYALHNNTTTRDSVDIIVQATPSYNPLERQKVIQANLRPLQHPYYSTYSLLQKICLQILKHESIKFGQEKDKTYGILFDGAWLWEEFIYTILRNKGYLHPENKRSIGGIRMFVDSDGSLRNSRKIYPDFYHPGMKQIIDAKYKRLNDNLGREDLYQVISYMHCMGYNRGCYIFPSIESSEPVNYTLAGNGGTLSVVPFFIPDDDNWISFSNQIANSTIDLMKMLDA